jgi:RNA polymerase sigma-70 factor, ECF subfamily
VASVPLPANPDLRITIVYSHPACWRGLDELRPVVLRFLTRRCRDEHEAEDLAQETLLRAARYRADLDRPRLRSWLVQIAANVLRDHARREGRGPRSGAEEGLIDGVADPRPAPGDNGREGAVAVGGRALDVDDALLHMAAAFTRLLERDRAVLTAYYGGGGDTRAVAVECGIPPSLVKVRLFRARRRLEALVRRRASVLHGRRLAMTA